MPQLLRICSILLLFLCSASASPLDVVASQPPPSTFSKIPHNPVSFSPPSQHAIPHHHQPLSDEDSALHGTIKVFPSHPNQAVPVSYTISSRVCAALISELTYLMSDVSQQLLSEHIAGIPFPIPPGAQNFPLPVYIAGNITEQLYRTKYVLSLALKLTPLEETLEMVTTSHWRSVISLLEQSVKDLARDARAGSGSGLGSVLTFQAETSGVRLHAEWKIWSIKDGVAVMCQS